MAASACWSYNLRVGDYICKRSGDIPIHLDGTPLIPWLKNGLDIYPAQSIDLAMYSLNLVKTVPPGRPDVRVWVRLEDWNRIKRGAVSTFPVDTTPKKIPDWPLPCPRCGQRESAVLLFTDYDCRHGCFNRRTG